MRPPGAVVLAGVRHSYLWLADGLGRPFLVSLRHPGLRLRCLAARGELSTARTIAERGLAPSFHDGVARFLVAMGGQAPGVGMAPPGVAEALALPGLSSAAELALSVRVGAWDRAARCFQARRKKSVAACRCLQGCPAGKGSALVGTKYKLQPSAVQSLRTTHPSQLSSQALALGVADKSLLLMADRSAGAGTGDVAGGLGRLTLSDTRGEEAVAAILEQATVAAAPQAPSWAANGNEQQQQQQQQNGAAEGSDEEGEESGEGAAADEPADPVNWDAALRGTSLATVLGAAASEREPREDAFGFGAEASSSTGASASASAGEGGGAAVALPAAVSPEERARVEAVTRLGLRFAEEAYDAGEADAARAALGVLVQFAHELPPRLLGELVARMGQCRMTESARNLAAAVAAGGPSAGALRDPGVAALLAALVGGYHGDAVQATLAGAGLAPLAAVHAAVWGSAGGDAALADWARQLQAGAADGRAVIIQPPIA